MEFDLDRVFDLVLDWDRALGRVLDRVLERAVDPVLPRFVLE